MRFLSLLVRGSIVAAVPAVIQPRQNEHLSVWVSVDPNGAATTISPIVTTTNGGTTTISPPPAALTASGVHTLTINGATTTSTGLFPVATASGNRDGNFPAAGVFLACDVNQDKIKPFCLPKTGSTLNPGFTYYITWNPRYFGSLDTTVDVQGTYADGTGFNSAETPASRGYYAWTVPSDILAKQGRLIENVTFFLGFNEGSPPVKKRMQGPQVWINKDIMSTPFTAPPTNSKVNIAAIVIPVILGVIVLALAAFCFWSWRKRGVLPLVGRFAHRSSLPNLATIPKRASSGYGGRQTHPQRTTGDTKRESGVQLSSTESWSPTSPTGSSRGANVFREEVRRQEAAGR